jgi:division protein CdvB (Snf7/Vps24/ESCRT-III family)
MNRMPTRRVDSAGPPSVCSAMQTSADRHIASLERQVSRLEETQRGLQARVDQLESKQFSLGLSKDTQEAFLYMTFLVAMIAFGLGLRG